MIFSMILDLLFTLALIFFVINGHYNANSLIVFLTINATLAAIQVNLLKSQTKPSIKFVFYASILVIALILITILAILLYTAKTIL